LLGKPQHISLDGPKGRIRKDHFLTLDRLKIVHSDPGRVAGPLRTRLQR
jgi:hypothetical protein